MSKRRELYISEMRDYVQLLQLSFNYYRDFHPDDARLRNQIMKVGAMCVTRSKQDKKITKPLLVKLSQYVEIMRTFDKKHIQKVGREYISLDKNLK